MILNFFFGTRGRCLLVEEIRTRVHTVLGHLKCVTIIIMWFCKAKRTQIVGDVMYACTNKYGAII
jgi:hypothetical protein